MSNQLPDKSKVQSAMTRLDALNWSLIRHRFLIYAIGLVLWVAISFYLPSFGRPPPSLEDTTFDIFKPPLVIAIGLMALNMVSTYLRRNLSSMDANDPKIYEFENDRIKFLQNYGTVTVLPAALAAAFTTTAKSAGNPLLLVYLGASVTAGVIALVPFWVSRYDWRPLTIVRHTKTVLLIWSVTWLVKAIVILLS